MPIQQLNETHELASAKGQGIWTLVHNGLDFVVLTNKVTYWRENFFMVTQKFQTSELGK